MTECISKSVFCLPSLCNQKERCGLFAVFPGAHSSCSVHWAAQWRRLWVLWPWGLWKELCCKWACRSQSQVTSQTRQWLCWKVHVYVCCAGAVLSSGSLCWDPWLWILHNHFSPGLISRTILFYPPREKLDVSLHWLLWRVSFLFRRMLSLPSVHMGFIPVPFSNVLTVYQVLFINLSFPLRT